MDTTNVDDGYGDEDYIDMELCFSPSQSREFEFQMSTAACSDKTADELFYKGRLLPLHLHPAAAPCTRTPLDSSTVSPSESRRASCELNPDDYFFEWSNELNTLIKNHLTKPPWSKKLTLIKNSILALKSFFTKSSCSHAHTLPKPEQSSKPYRHIPKTPVATKLEGFHETINVPRRSFSSAIKRHSPTKCLSSSSSNSSSSSSSFSLTSHELHSLRRSSSAAEIEGSIEAAIAHCKKSHQNNS